MNSYSNWGDRTEPTKPPFVWPSVSILAGSTEYPNRVPFEGVLDNATVVFGVIAGLDDSGSEWLSQLLRRRDDISMLLILAVFGGCPTRRRDLERLLNLQECSAGRIDFRLLPMDTNVGAPANCLVATGTDNREAVALVGPTFNFGLKQADRTQVNFAFPVEAVLLDNFRRWFDWTWLTATPLTADTADIPALVPATGTLEAAALWEDYCLRCFAVGGSTFERGAEAPALDPESGEVRASRQDGDAEPLSPTEILKLPKRDKVAERVARLYAAGKQVTIASSAAVRPLDVPVNPGIFGQQSRRRDGSIEQRQEFRVSVFSEDELKTINNFRRGSQAIIGRISLPLEKGVHWIPAEAIPILKREIESLNDKAQIKVKGIIGCNIEKFIESKIDKIKEDVSNVYERLGHTGEVPQSAITELTDELKRRITLSVGEHFVAPVTFTSVGFDPPTNPIDSGAEAPWVQARQLVLALARFPRDVFTQPKKLGGLETPRQNILEAMDVEGDCILKEPFGRKLEDWARDDKSILDRIVASDIGDRARCEAGFMLIDGQSLEVIEGYIAENRRSRRSRPENNRG